MSRVNMTACFFLISAVAFIDQRHTTAAEEAIAKSDTKLTGRWRLVSVAPNQSEQHDMPQWEILEKFRFDFSDDTLTLDTIYFGKHQLQFELDASKSPHWINMTHRDEQGDIDSRLKGIYAFDGAKLKLCIGEKNQERPAEFIGRRDDSGRMISCMMVFERVESDASPEPQAVKR